MIKKCAILVVFALMLLQMPIYAAYRSEPVAATVRMDTTFWVFSEEDLFAATSRINSLGATNAVIHVWGNLELTETVVVTGSNITIRFIGNGRTIRNNHGNTISVNGSTLIFENIIISGGGTGIRATGGSTITINNNSVITNNGRHGVEMIGSSTLTVTNSVISHNQESGIHTDTANVSVLDSTIERNLDGISVAGQTPTVIVRDSIIRNNRGRGILTHNTSNIAIYDSEITGNTFDGVSGFNRTNITINDSSIEGNLRWGVRADRHSTVVVNRSTVENSGAHGIYARNSDVTVNNSSVNLNRGNGIYTLFWGCVVSCCPTPALQPIPTLAANDVRVMYNTESGFFIQGAVATVQESTIAYNDVDGITLRGDVRSSINLRNSIVRENKACGIIAHMPADVNLYRSSVLANTLDGIVGYNHSSVVLDNSQIEGNLRLGIRVDRHSTLTANNSIVSANGTDGIYARNSDITVFGGAIRNSGIHGIRLVFMDCLGSCCQHGGQTIPVYDVQNVDFNGNSGSNIHRIGFPTN